MKTLFSALVILVSTSFHLACGYPTATHCDSRIYGVGVDSVLPIDCVTFEYDAHLARGFILNHAKLKDKDGNYTIPIEPGAYDFAMSLVHVEVKSVDWWCDRYVGGCEQIAGQANYNYILLNKSGWPLVHESLHEFDEIYAGPIGFELNMANEKKHKDWDKNGYYLAQMYFATYYTPLDGETPFYQR